MSLRLAANVAEAGDILLFFVLLGVTLVVGLMLFAIDAVVGRLAARRTARQVRTVASASGAARRDRAADPDS